MTNKSNIQSKNLMSVRRNSLNVKLSKLKEFANGTSFRGKSSIYMPFKWNSKYEVWVWVTAFATEKTVL